MPKLDYSSFGAEGNGKALDYSAFGNKPVQPTPQPLPSVPPNYGVSTIKDTTSQKPLLTYSNEGMKSSQLLQRTVPGFDFTKPQKIDPTTLSNERMKQDVSSGLRASLGATAKEQLDHIMPLELGGSNAKANLRLEPTAKGVNTATDPIENQATKSALNGDISVLDAWRQVAKAKGITLEEDMKLPSLPEVSKAPPTLAEQLNVPGGVIGPTPEPKAGEGIVKTAAGPIDVGAVYDKLRSIFFEPDPVSVKAQALNNYYYETHPNAKQPELSTADKISNQVSLMSPAEKALSVVVLSSLVTAPAAAIPAILQFTAIDKGIKWALSKVTGKEVANFSDLVPAGSPQITKDFVDVLGFIGEGAATHGLTQAEKPLLEKVTKDVVTNYNLPKEVYIDGSKIKDIFQTGTKISPEEMKMVQDLGLNADQYKQAIQNGLRIAIPPEKITTVTDKPYWAKLKELLGVSAQEPKVTVTTAGKTAQAPAGLLESGKPAELTPVAPVVPPTKPIAPEAVKPLDYSKFAAETQKPESSILEEAKKYKSAEEFVKAPSKQMIEMAKEAPYRVSDFENTMSGQRFFHGTASDFNEFDMSKIGKTHHTDWGNGISLAKDENVAQAYKRSAIQGTNSKGLVKEFYIDPAAKIYDFHKTSPRDISPGLADKLKKDGYDALYVYDELGRVEEAVVMNPKVIYSPSQLTDIWNQANRATKEVSNLEVSPRTIPEQLPPIEKIEIGKTLSKETLPTAKTGEIIQTINGPKKLPNPKDILSYREQTYDAEGGKSGTINIIVNMKDGSEQEFTIGKYMPGKVDYNAPIFTETTAKVKELNNTLLTSKEKVAMNELHKIFMEYNAIKEKLDAKDEKAGKFRLVAENEERALKELDKKRNLPDKIYNYMLDTIPYKGPIIYESPEEFINSFINDREQIANIMKSSEENKPTLQKEQVKTAIAEGPKSIKEVAEQTKILEPNVRRILGVGAKEGTFERVSPGVYVLKDAAGKESAYIEAGDAKDVLMRMVNEGKKFDSVILDPAYFSKALVGGNRGIKAYDFIDPTSFENVMSAVYNLVKNDDTHVYLMLSGAKTAQVDILKYAEAATKYLHISGQGFKLVGEGSYQKTFKDGSPVTNPRGEIAAPERILLFTKSGKAREGEIPTNLNFRFVRPSIRSSYPTEKPAGLIEALIRQSTFRGESVLDPFAGSGVTGAEALKAGRKPTLVEKKPEVVENVIKPRLEKTLSEKKSLLKELGAELTDMEQYGDPNEFPEYQKISDEYNQLKDELTSLKELPEIPVKEPKVKEEGVVLRSGFDPGLDKFLSEDVKPRLGNMPESVGKFFKEVVNLLNPKAGVDTKTLDEIFKMKGARDKAEALLDLATEKVERSFDKMTQQENIDFIDRVKRGEKQPTPELQAIADFMREVDNNLYSEVQKYKPDINWLEDHYRVLWKTVPGKPEAKGFMGLFRRPLRGTMGFLGPASLEDMTAGLKAGGEPVTYNPVTMFKLSYADAMRFITAHRMWDNFGETGTRIWLPWSDKMPEGFVELQDNIKRVVKPEGEKSGRWVVEEGAGRLLNNFLSKDLIRATAAGRGLMWIKNSTTAAELSLSAFHWTFETIETMSSGMGVGFRKLWNLGAIKGNIGQIGEGLKDIITSPITPKSTFQLGRRMLDFMKSKEAFLNSEQGKKFIKQFPDAARLMDDFFNGGGKLKMSRDYEIGTAKVFMQNLNNGNYIGAAIRSIPALNETIMHPLFNVYIPALKIGMFMKEFPLRLLERADDLASGKVTREQLARETVDFVENRLGEMNFDNLMWNRTFKTALQLAFRSVTWKLGNIRAFGNAITGQTAEFWKAAKEGRPPQVTPEAAWMMALIINTALIATITMKAFTGKYPQTIKDLVYPQSDPHDPNQRFSLPTYLRDAFSLVHSPWAYLVSSMSGEISKIMEVWHNADFYNTEIYNATDPLLTKVGKSAEHLLPIPFGVQNLLQPNQTPARKIGGFIGLTKAPAYISETPIQTAIYGLYQTRFGGGTQTQEATDVAKAKTAIRNAYLDGNSEQANKLLADAINKGYIKPTGADTFIKNADIPGDVRAFSRFDPADQEGLFRQMDMGDLMRYAWEAKPEVKAHFSDISQDTKQFVEDLNAGKIKPVTWVKGEAK